MRKRSRFVYVSLLFFVFFLIGCDTFIVSPLIPLITSSLHITPDSGGFLVTTYSIFYVIFSPILGPLSDHIGRKKMIGIGIIIFSISSFATGAASNYALILLARCITGIGAAFTAPNIWSFIGDYFEYKERGKFTAIIASGLSLGMIFGVPIGSSLAQWKSWNISFYAIGILSLLAGLSILIIFPTINLSGALVKVNFKEQFIKVLNIKNILYSFIVTFFISFANFGLYTYLGNWLSSSFSLSVSRIGFVMLIAGLGNLIGMQIGGFFSDKFGKKKIVFISLIVLAISLLTLPLYKSNLLIAVIDIFVWLGTGGAAFTIMQVLVTNLKPEARGTIMAFNNSFMWTGTAFGSGILSLIIRYSGFPIASLMCFIVALAACIVLKLLIKENDNKVTNEK